MANEVDIFAKRLKSARVKAKLSMNALCELMNNIVSKQTISKYENGKMLPTSTILIALADVLSVDIDYFFRPYEFDMQDIEVSFRKKRSVSAKEEASLKEQIHDEIERYLEIERILDVQVPPFHPVNTAPIHTYQDMCMRAQEIRRDWNLGDAPISNVQSLLESKNIRVILLDNSPEGFDGLSGVINRSYPVIVLRRNPIIERQRFTALHELAHILYNEYMDEDLTEHERENLCNAFACEMLVGSSNISSVFSRNRNKISLAELYPLQQEFGVSIDAMIIKAHQLGLMSESRYCGYYIQKNKNNLFKSRAEESRFKEESTHRFESLVYSALAQGLITESKAAAFLDKSVDVVHYNFNLV